MRVAVILTALSLVGAAASAQEITPNIAVSTSAGPSPLAVSFDAIATTHSDSRTNTNRFNELAYLWDYGDPTSGTWAPTGNSRNQMSGALGAHVFEAKSFPDCGGACKIFTVTLTVKDAAGRAAIATKHITVYDPEHPIYGWGSPGKTVCVSRTSDHAGCPVAATRKSNDARTFQKVLSDEIASGARRVLFHGGQTWQSTATYNMGANGPILLGSYGGGNAIVECTAQATFGVGVYRDWRIQDLTFRSASPLYVLFAAAGGRGAREILIRRTVIPDNSFRGVLTWPLNFLQQSADDELAPRHIFIVDNNWGRLGGQARVHTYIVGWGLYWLGNTLGDTTNGEHGIRIEHGRDVLISNNQMGLPASTKHSLSFRDIPNVCGLCPRPLCAKPITRYLVQFNDLTCATNSCIQVGLQTCALPGIPKERLPEADIVVEGNFFKSPAGTQGAVDGVSFGYADCDRCVVRNNIHDATGSRWYKGIVSGGRGGVKALNNTCFRSDTSADGVATCISGSGMAECSNNVMYAPNWTKAIYAIYDAATSCRTMVDNLSNAPGGGITSNPFLAASPQRRADFMPSPASQLLNRASPRVAQDCFGTCRADQHDVGAVERDGQSCFFPVPRQIIP